MSTVVGVFKSGSDANSAVSNLAAAGVSHERINILTPGKNGKQLDQVPTAVAEQPGMVKAVGAVTGGAVGLGLGQMAASLLLPGVGPVIAVGLAAGGLLGALGGGAVGAAAEKSLFPGLPQDELFVYEDALRQGRAVLVVLPEDKTEADTTRQILEQAGAESVDRAREMWWLGLRDVEQEEYETSGQRFQNDETDFRAGFEAALHLENRDKSYDQCRAELARRYSLVADREAFRRGFARGSLYGETIARRYGSRPIQD